MLTIFTDKLWNLTALKYALLLFRMEIRVIFILFTNVLISLLKHAKNCVAVVVLPFSDTMAVKACCNWSGDFNLSNEPKYFELFT